MSAEAIKSFLLEGLRWPTKNIVMKEMYSVLSSPALRPMLFWLIVRFLVFVFACLLFHPILRAVSRWVHKHTVVIFFSTIIPYHFSLSNIGELFLSQSPASKLSRHDIWRYEIIRVRTQANHQRH